MAKHRTGYSVARIITLVLMRDPRITGIVAGTLYGTLTCIGIDMTEAEAFAHTRDIRDWLYEPDVVDGERLSVGSTDSRARRGRRRERSGVWEWIAQYGDAIRELWLWADELDGGEA